MRRSIRVSVTVISSTAGIASDPGQERVPSRLDICVTSSKGEYPKICRVEGAVRIRSEQPSPSHNAQS